MINLTTPAPMDDFIVWAKAFYWAAKAVRSLMALVKDIRKQIPRK